MPPTAKELREKRKPLGDRVQQMRDAVYKDDQGAALAEPRAFTTEERAEWDRVNKEYDGLTAQVQVAERAEQVAQEQTAPAGGEGRFDPRGIGYDGRKAKKERTAEETKARREARSRERDVEARGWLAGHVTEEDRCLALQGWMRRMSGLAPKPRHEEAAKKTGLDLRRKYLDLNIASGRDYRALQRQAYGLTPEGRALGVNVNTAGGYTVPEGFVNTLETALLAYANVRQWADVMRTASGQDLPWPTVNDTTQKGAILAENATVSSTGHDVTFGQTILHAYKYTSNLVLVPVELMEDSAFDLASTLGELLGIRIGRIQADHFTAGTGNAQPQGYVAASQTFAAAAGTAIAADDLYKLKHKVDPAYRAQPGVGWTLHDQILLQIKLLKDGLGRYLWQASLAGGRPDMIDNDPLYINQSMDSTISSGKKTVAYGALKKYKIRDVSQIRLRRLVERYADSDQEGFVMFMRSDGQLLDAGTHPVYVLQH